MTKIFYSWQSDHHEKTCKYLIRDALKAAVKELGSSPELEEAIREGLEIQTDIADAPGSPEIAKTIFERIEKASAFVADITFVARRPEEKGQCPNPNVLIEYGWALNKHDNGKILRVMNTHYGDPTPTSMPFDMRHVGNVVTFNLAPDATNEEIKRAKKDLTRRLKNELQKILKDEQESEDQRTFRARESKDGAARFRSSGHPIGTKEGSSVAQAQTPVFLKHGAAIWVHTFPSEQLARPLLHETLRDHMLRPFPILPKTSMGADFVRGSDGFGTYSVEGAYSQDRTPDIAESVAYFLKLAKLGSLMHAAYRLTQIRC